MDEKYLLYCVSFGITVAVSLVAGLYLLLSRRVVTSGNLRPIQPLRREAGWYALVVAASHILLILSYFTGRERLTADVTCSFFDMFISLPFIIHFNANLLQNRRTPWRPALLADIPLVVCATGYFLCFDFKWAIAYCALFILILSAFSLIYFSRVHGYRQWLHENYPGLEHSETWWCLAMMGVILLFFLFYFVYDGSLTDMYVMRLMVVLLIGSLTFRVDGLQRLDIASGHTDGTAAPAVPDVGVAVPEVPAARPVAAPVDFTAQLEELADKTKFYLEYDLSLHQLAKTLKTNRTYLGQYFAARGTTYNAYVNGLRIRHFISLYREAAGNSTPLHVKQLAQQSGYRSYYTFRDAFKRVMHCPPTDWLEREGAPAEGNDAGA